MVGTAFVRDTAMMAAIFGVAAFMWFGWAQEDPPRTWRVPLAAGAALSLMMGIAGGIIAWRNWELESALAAEGGLVRFGIVVGVEISLIVVVSVALAWSKRARWISCWICLVVGLHFVPLAVLFRDSALYILAAVLVLAAGAGVILARRTGIHPSAITGLGAGAALALFALRSLLGVLTATI